MCMIAHRYLSQKGKGANIPNAVIDTALVRHPDGFGIAWREPGEGLVYDKFGPDEKAEFRAMLKQIDARKDVEYVAHFRFATHGPEDAEHAHPYSYEDPKEGTVLVFHNGVFSSMKTTKLESDTEVFVRDFLAKLPSRWWVNAGIRKLVDEIGGWSKLVLMTERETVNLNHYSGEDDRGLWYSSNHRPYTYAYQSLEDDWERDGWAYVNGSWKHDDKKKPTSNTAARESFGALVAPTGEEDTTFPRSNGARWAHMGHELTPLQKFDFQKDGDYEMSVLCDTCQTAGDVYIIDGKAYIDIPHAWSAASDGEEVEGTVTVEEAPAGLLLPGGDNVTKVLEKIGLSSGKGVVQ